nr:MAG TPA: hypothetical protein [Caudoviricetes sp.]
MNFSAAHGNPYRILSCGVLAPSMRLVRPAAKRRIRWLSRRCQHIRISTIDYHNLSQIRTIVKMTRLTLMEFVRSFSNMENAQTGSTGGAAVQYHAAVQGLLRLGAHGLMPVQEVCANG